MLDFDAECRMRLDECTEAEASIEAARIGQHPCGGASESDRLAALNNIA